MAGYYRDPEATRRAIDPDGWLFTGDLARRGDSGTYRIVGRRKELIIRGGENIYPPEVEEFLHHHDDVAEVAVVGLPDAKYGEIVAAWIVPRAGAAPSAGRDQGLLPWADLALQDSPAYLHRGEPAQDRDRQGAQARPQRKRRLRAWPLRGGGDSDGVMAEAPWRRARKTRREGRSLGRLRRGQAVLGRVGSLPFGRECLELGLERLGPGLRVGKGCLLLGQGFLGGGSVGD